VGDDELTLADVGEFGLIHRVAVVLAQHGPWSPGDVGLGDDAAVVGLGTDPRVVATTDMLVEGRHFRRDWSSAYDIGRKAAAQNLADLEAMGARPVALLVAFGAPGTTTVAFGEDLARGLADEAAKAGASVVGGDTVAADVVTVSVTALGSLDGRRPVTRSGARVGDEIFVVGRLGWPRAGLALLQRGDPALLDKHAALVECHRAPQPPYGAGRAAAEAGATAMIDVSDGLGADLGHLLEASGVAAELSLRDWRDEALDAAAADLGADVRLWLVAGGEEHALVVCAPAGTPIAGTRIGRITAGEGIRLADGGPVPAGFDHFGSA
jgi:thiamine-monophosphate kinase